MWKRRSFVWFSLLAKREASRIFILIKLNNKKKNIHIHIFTVKFNSIDGTFDECAYVKDDDDLCA